MTLQLLDQKTPDRALVLTKAIIRASDIWKLKNRELAAILGLSDTTVSRLRDGKFRIRPETKSGELAILLLRLFRGLDAFTGGHEDNQRRWLEAPNIALGAAPLASIQSVAGLAYAVQYMDFMRGK